MICPIGAVHYLLYSPCCQESRQSSKLSEGRAKRIYCLPSQPEPTDHGWLDQARCCTSPCALCSSAAETQHEFESSQISSQHFTRLHKPSGKAGQNFDSEARGHYRLAQQLLCKQQNSRAGLPLTTSLAKHMGHEAYDSSTPQAATAPENCAEAPVADKALGKFEAKKLALLQQVQKPSVQTLGNQQQRHLRRMTLCTRCIISCIVPQQHTSCKNDNTILDRFWFPRNRSKANQDLILLHKSYAHCHSAICADSGLAMCIRSNPTQCHLDRLLRNGREIQSPATGHKAGNLHRYGEGTGP